MKTRRIASSIALAAAVALGATGCGLVAPQGTTHVYAPSDGIDITLDDIALRNLMLIADKSGRNFNVVFSGINSGTAPQKVRMTFVNADQSKRATADFVVEPGRTLFGDPKGEVEPVLVSLTKVNAGDTVTAFVEIAGAEAQRQVPVLDGTLREYQRFVL